MAGMATPDAGAIPVPRPSNVTFSKDVARIVQQPSQGYHRSGADYRVAASFTFRREVTLLILMLPLPANETASRTL
jgi:hypothetical protein